MEGHVPGGESSHGGGELVLFHSVGRGTKEPTYNHNIATHAVLE